MKTKISLFRKIFFFSISLIIFTIVLSFTMSLFLSDKFYIARRKEEIKSLVPNIKKLVYDRSILEDYIDEIRDTQGIDIFVVDNIYYDSFYELEIDNNYDDIEEGFQINHMEMGNVVILLYKEKISPKKTLFISTSLSVMNAHKKEMYFLNILAFLISLFLATLISNYFAKKITGDINKISSVAKKIAKLDFSEMVELKNDDELKELGENINVMSQNLKSSIENLKSFVSNASHELKTPITVINTYTQLALKEDTKPSEDVKKYLRVILNESVTMNELVKNLLLLSRLSSLDLKLEKRELDLSRLIEESLEKYEFLELSKDISWDIRLDDAKIVASPKFFPIALNNIIQNALKYSKEGGVVKILKKENEIIFENSVILYESESSSLTEAFSRGINANELGIEGNGLGLSIVKKILDLHNFSFEIETSRDSFRFILTY